MFDALIIGCISAVIACFCLLMSIPLLAICRWVSSLQTEIDLVVRSCKLDMSYVYKTGNGAKWKMTPVDEGNKDDDGWASFHCRMSSLGFDCIAATMFIVCILLLFSYGCIVCGGFFACIIYIVDCLTLTIQLILVVMLIGSLVATQLLYIALHMIRFDYKANVLVSFHLTTSLLLTITYDHLNGYTCRMTPLSPPQPQPQPVVDMKDEMAKKNYDAIVAVQWRLLCDTYKVVDSPKQYLRLYEDGFGVHNPLLPPNRDKLIEMGYTYESTTCYCLKFNGEEAHRKRFVDAQVNMLLTKYLYGPKLKQCIDIDLADIDDVNNPLFPSVAERLQDSGFNVVYHTRTIGDREARQLQLRFVYVPK